MSNGFVWVKTQRIGQITGVEDPQKQERALLTNTRTWGVEGVDLGANVEHNNRLYILFGDVAVSNYDGTQQPNSDLIAWTEDPKVLERGGHRAPEGSWNFFLPNKEQGASETTGQPDWRFCGKCHALFWSPEEQTVESRCPYDGGEHFPLGLNFVLPNKEQGATEATGQWGWRYCGRCRGLCWSPQGEVPVGSCPAGGRHAPIGWTFVLPNKQQGHGPTTGQGSWAFCGGCEGLYFDGYAGKGVCPGPLDGKGQPIRNGGGIRLNAVQHVPDPQHPDRERFYPLTATDPVGVTTDLETPSGAFSHDNRLYAFVGVAHPRYSKQIRPGDPAVGNYLISSDKPDRPEMWTTEFQLSPRIGVCKHAVTGALLNHDPRGFMFVLPKDPHHGKWRFCRHCAGLFREGDGDGHCFGADGGRHEAVGDRFILPAGVAEDEQNQASWRRCARCRTAYYDGYPAKGNCPAGGVHQRTDSVLTLPHRSYRDDGLFQKPETELLQRSWRFCGKCAGMFWEGDFRNQHGVCPASGEHDPWGLNFLLAINEGPNRQKDWRFCGKCNGLFWSNADGVCPGRTGPHQIGGGPGFEGFNFALTHDITPSRTQQRNWRFCGKCGGLFFAGAAGVCPKDRKAHQAGAGPGAPGHDFVLPHDPGEDPLHQENWRFCQRCFGLVYAGQYDWFGAASPVVVNTDEHRDLPPSPSGRGVVLLGFGYNPPGGYRLAWLPLPQSGPPRVQDTQYWQGAGEWSPNADNSVNLFDRKPLSYTSISLNWLKDPGVWVMLYSHATNEQALTEFEKPVMARFAATPWDLATAPDVPIFDPCPDRENAYGVYMNSTDGADEFDIPPGDKSKGWAYGAYLIERYTHWNPNTRELTLVYLLSLRSPYQVQLMQTTVHMT